MAESESQPVQMNVEVAEHLSVEDNVTKRGVDTRLQLDPVIKELPSRLSYGNFSLCLVSAFLFILDYGINIIIFRKYFQLHKRHDQFETYFYIIVVITLLPPVVTAMFEVVWYKEEKFKYGRALKWNQWIIRIILMVVLLGPAFRYIEILEHAYKTAKIDSLKVKQKNVKMALQMKEDADFLYMLEKFTESGLHIVLQMFIVKVEMAGDDYEVIGFEEALKISMAVLMMPYSITIYLNSHHQAVGHGNNMGWTSTVVQFIWRLFIIIPQAICQSFFLDVYPSEFVLITFATFAFMAVWVFMEGTEFCREKVWLECVFRFFVAFVYLFTFFNVSKEDTYYKAVFYHCFIFMERALMTCFWCLGEDQGAWYRWPTFAAFFLFFAVGVFFQLLYYGFMHPTKPKFDINKKNLLPIKLGFAGKIPASQTAFINIHVPSPLFPVSFNSIYGVHWVKAL